MHLSDDRKKVRCNICQPLQGHSNKWIQKGSLSNHLKSDLHACSIRAQQERDSIRMAGERSLQEEWAIEQSMDFAMLSMSTKSTATTKQPVFKPSAEEQEMWDNSTFHTETFSTGIDHAAEERKRLEKEATDLDLWCSANFPPEEDPNYGELPLDELEQDRLTEFKI